MDIPHNELRELAKAYVKQATPIVREQERILAQLDGHPGEESLLRRLRQTVALASDLIADQEELILSLKEGETARA
jgi:hypothetical protein